MIKVRVKHSKGYWLVYRPDHPFRNNHGYIPEARLVMEEAIERYVLPIIEDVHHIDEDVQNNELKNLVLLTKSEHRRLHSGWKLIDGEWWKTCKGCGRFLKVESNFYKRPSSHYEYYATCNECHKDYSKVHGKKYYLSHKTMVISCPICSKVKFVSIYNNKTIYCSIKCSWVARKGVVI